MNQLGGLLWEAHARRAPQQAWVPQVLADDWFRLAVLRFITPHMVRRDGVTLHLRGRPLRWLHHAVSDDPAAITATVRRCTSAEELPARLRTLLQDSMRHLRYLMDAEVTTWWARAARMVLSTPLAAHLQRIPRTIQFFWHPSFRFGVCAARHLKAGALGKDIPTLWGDTAPVSRAAMLDMKWLDTASYRSHYRDANDRLWIITGPLGLVNGACKSHANIYPSPRSATSTDTDWRLGSLRPRREVRTGAQILCDYGADYSVLCPTCGGVSAGQGTL